MPKCKFLLFLNCFELYKFEFLFPRAKCFNFCCRMGIFYGVAIPDFSQFKGENIFVLK